ncbi:unnamed protein product [Microthlaspi erraticum]|uniref:Uncharacterized protein n=1 Tax=Microthlaspi erraticum TaxID=1685480 RepID=A0A6D2IRZ6_9BRAS|nr:unnamed protein product [Microthlaspi erraticum]
MGFSSNCHGRYWFGPRDVAVWPSKLHTLNRFVRALSGSSVHSPVCHLSWERMLARHFFMGELTVNWFGTDFARCFVRTSHEKGQRPAKTLLHSLARRSVNELKNGFGTELAHDSARHDICTGDGSHGFCTEVDYRRANSFAILCFVSLARHTPILTNFIC